MRGDCLKWQQSDQMALVLQPHLFGTLPVERKYTEMNKSMKEWDAALVDLHGRIAQRFRRAEPRTRAKAYLQGLLSRCERKMVGSLQTHRSCHARWGSTPPQLCRMERVMFFIGRTGGDDISGVPNVLTTKSGKLVASHSNCGCNIRDCLINVILGRAFGAGGASWRDRERLHYAE